MFPGRGGRLRALFSIALASDHTPVSQRTRKRIPRWLLAPAAAAVLVAILALAADAWLSPLARREIIRRLEEKYDSQVEVGALSVSLLPLRASGEKLVFRRNGHPGDPPLITLKRFEASAGWIDVLRRPHHVRLVRLEGLVIQVSPRKHQERDDPPEKSDSGNSKAPIVVDEIVADGTILRILPKDAGKNPLKFDIYQLTLTSAGNLRPMHYRAQLRNAKPPGLIDANGDFGPWNSGDPGQTPVGGQYTFSNADLGVFKGISGRLSSTGQFHGVLERIEVNGHTDTPEFAVAVAGHKVHLKTDFSATVDGENGDTLLHPVDAEFGRTRVHCEGGVEAQPGEHGKTVTLDDTVQDGDLADVLRLGVHSDPPPMTGRISFRARIVIPPGDRDIADKLRLEGQFGIRGGKFTKFDLQRKVAALSEKSQGGTEGAGGSDVVSKLRGQFRLRDGVIYLSGLSFAVPGATIRLSGSYGLRNEQLDFQGTVTTQARVSEMTTGWKSFLLKALDPFLSKHRAGAVIPIHIGGTRRAPEVGLDLKP